MEAAVAYAKAEADNLMATELRLGLPGTAGDDQTPKATPRGKKRTTTFDAVEDDTTTAKEANTKGDVDAAPPAAK
jgi:auxin-responsive protein IAA